MTKISARRLQIVPSLLAADLGRLAEQLRQVQDAGVTWVSVDVMDGHFVPNLSFGPDFVRLVKRCGLTVDVHLMVANPEAVAPWFVDAGADFVTVHHEACASTAQAAADIRGRGAKAGVAIKPRTTVEPLVALLGDIDLALVMTVEPGFGGAKFMPEMRPKLETLRRAIDARGVECWLQVDGGVNPQTAVDAASWGADSLVAGSAVFGSRDVASAVRAITEAARQGASRFQ